MSDKEPPSQGSRDFFHEASHLLDESDTPHILICGYNKGRFAYRSCNVSPESINWFEKECVGYIADLRQKMREGGFDV